MKVGSERSWTFSLLCDMETSQVVSKSFTVVATFEC